jgi:hypothetical protein
MAIKYRYIHFFGVNVFEKDFRVIFVCFCTIFLSFELLVTPLLFENKILLAVSRLSNPSYYEDLEISIAYSSDWNIKSDFDDSKRIIFSVPSPISPNMYKAIVIMSVHELKLPTESANLRTNISISDLSSHEIFNTYSFARIDYLNRTFNVLNVSDTFISTLPAYKVDFETAENVSGFIAWTINNNKIYSLNFASDDTTYSDYLPQAKIMMNSINIKNR